MNLPSIKRISELTDTREDAKLIRSILEVYRDRSNVRERLALMPDERIKKVLLRYPHTSRPRLPLVMECIDAILDTCGVESLVNQDEILSTRGVENEVYYCNTGDTYAATLLFVRVAGNGRFVVSSWGDVIEGLERRGVNLSCT